MKLLIVCLAFFLSAILALPQQKLTPREARALIDKDFEDGRISPWFDDSPNDLHWLIETYSTPFEPTYPVPEPFSGVKYMRVQRDPNNLLSGRVVLCSPIIDAYPGDQLGFDFWIRSRLAQTNNLLVRMHNRIVKKLLCTNWKWSANTIQVIFNRNGTEYVLESLSHYSSPANLEWRSHVTRVNLTQPLTGSVTAFFSTFRYYILSSIRMLNFNFTRHVNNYSGSIINNILTI